MADVQIIGNITAVTNEAVLLRASGEQLVISPSTIILPGDTIVTSDDSSVIIEFKDEITGIVTGHGKIENGKIIRFDDISLVNINPLLIGSTADKPVNLGSNSNTNLQDFFEQQAPAADSGISTAESSRSQQVISRFDAVFANRNNQETLPNATTETTIEITAPVVPTTPQEPRSEEKPVVFNPITEENKPTINTPATLTNVDNTLAYIEDSSPQIIDNSVDIADLDDTQLESATITISSGFSASEDSLSFTNTAAIIGNYNAATGVLTLTGSDTLANYEAALESIRYTNTSDNPSSINRTITWVVNDGESDSVAQTSTITVAPVDNDAPVISNAAGTLAYTEGDGNQIIDNSLSVNDVDGSQATSATISISSGFIASEDTLSFTDTATITGSYNAATGVLTLTGTDDLADYETALESIRYNNSSNNPDTTDRIISWVISDGSNTSTASTSTITITDTNDISVISDAAGTLSYTEGDGAQIIDNSLSLNDNDDTHLESATISITSGFNSSEDSLSFTDTANITGSYNAVTGVLTLTGTDTLANYEAALESIRYENSSDNPSTLNRTVSWIVNDGSNNSATQTSTITVTPTDDDAPVISNVGSILAYSEDDGAQIIDNSISISDVDDAEVASATISISSGFISSEDELSFTNTGTITGTYNAATGVLTLTGTDSLASYEAALESIRYNNSSDNPNTGNRTISWIISDGGGNASTPQTSTITVTSLDNDAPVISSASGTLTYTEDDGAQIIDNDLSLSDVDDTHFASATISISAGFVSTEDTLSFTNTANITGSYNATTGVLTLTGNDTITNYKAALESITYNNSNNNPSTANRTISWLVNDGNNDSALQTSTITIAPNDNDAPVITDVGSTLAYTEDDGAQIIDSSITLGDVDDTHIESATISISGGFVASEDSLSFTDTANITGSYNAATGVLTLTGTDSLASYEAALESIRYNNSSDTPDTGNRTISWQVSDGTNTSNTGNSTITVAIVNDAPFIALQAPVDLAALNALTATLESSATATEVSLDPYSATLPDLFYFDVTVDTTANGNQVLFESGGSGTGLVVFQTGADLRVAIGNDNNVDLTLSNVLVNNTRYGIVVELATGNQLNIYQGELDGSGNPTGAINLISTTTWSGSSDWSGTDGGGWGTTSGSQQAQAVVSYTNFAGTWHNGQFFSEQSAPLVTATSTISGGTLEYTEGDGAQLIDSNLSLGDVDDTNIESATISISSGFQTGEDVLSFINTANISGSYNSTTGVLTLTGSDTLANYEAALESIRYNNTSENPNTTPRTVSWVVNDGSDNSSTATSTINVTTVNDAPELLVSSGIDIDALNLMAPTQQSSTETTVASFDPYSSAVPDFFYFDVTVDTAASGNQVLFESGGAGTGIAIFQDGSDLRVAVGNDNNVDLTISNTFTNNTRYGIVVELAAGNQLNIYQGELDGSGNPTGDISLISTSTWAGGTDWSGSDGGGWGRISNAIQSSAIVSYTDFAGTWHTGRFYSEASAPLKTLSYVENDGAQVINNNLTINDLDDTNIESATISITGGFVNSEDVLAFSNTANITGNYNSATGVLTLTGSDTLANYEAALESVTYENTANPPNTSDRTVTWVINDGDNNSTSASSTINVKLDTAIPVIADAAGTLAYTENDGAQIIDDSLTLTDADNTHLVSATIRITSGLMSSEDVLAFTDTANITGSYNSATGVLTLTGSDTVANYEAALESITYENTNTETPTAGDRTISWVVNDGNASSVAVASTISVSADNDLPVLSLTPAADISAINVLTPTLQSSVTGSISSLQSYASSAPDVFYFDVTVDTTVNNNQIIFETGGTGTGLAVAQQGNNLIVSLGDGNDVDLLINNVLSNNTRYGIVLELAENNLLNLYLGELDGSGSPTGNIELIGSTTWSGANWSGSNSAGWGIASGGSVQGSSVLTYTDFAGTWHNGEFFSGESVTQALIAGGGTLNYSEGDGAQVIDSSVSISDVDDTNIESATITISGGFVNDEDVLGFTNTANITGNYNAATGVLTLTGSDTLANYQAALATITYENTSAGPNTGNRTISWVVNDGDDNSSAVTSTITVASINDTPVISLLFSDANSVDMTAVNALTPTLQSSTMGTISTLQSHAADAPDFFYFDVTVDTDPTNNQLIFETGGTGTGFAISHQGTNLVASLGASNNVDLTLSNVLVDNTRYGIVVELAAGNQINIYLGELDNSGNPTSSITLIGNATWDGSNWSGSNGGGWGTISGSVQGQPGITYTNFAGTWHEGRFFSGESLPTGGISISGGTLAYTEGDGAQIIDSTLSVTDNDDTNIESATISITSGFINGEDVLNFTNTANITGNYNAATGVLTLTGSDTLANYQSALASITYENTSSTPDTGNRTISWVINDGDTNSSTATSTVTVTSVINGDALDNPLTGTNGSDIIFGNAGNDTLSGSGGEDIIYGGIGSDSLFGNILGGGVDTESDTFFWQLGDQGAGLNGSNVETDTINDFTAGTTSSGGDILNLSDLLIGETSGTINNYISLTDDGSDTTLFIDVTGDSSGTDLQLVLLDITGSTLSSLIGDGNLIIDT